MRLKNVTIGDLERLESGNVYVLNQTSGVEKGNVLMTIPKKHGQGMDTIKVVATFIPVNLAEQVPKETLLESSDFRKAINSRRLKIVDEGQANQILETKEAQEEIERIINEEDKIRNFMSNDSEGTVEDIVNYDIKNKPTTVTYTGVDDNENSVTRGVNVNIISMVDDINDGVIDEISAISTMRNLENIKKRDCRYVYKNVPKKLKRLKEVALEISETLKKRKEKK